MEQIKIADNLQNVFSYAFIETVPYSFFIPTRDKYVAVNLPHKRYHCQNCGKEIEVKYNQNGVVYFSRERFAKQREYYEKHGLEFPDKKAIKAEQPFTYHEEGYCSECANSQLQNVAITQDIYNLCQKIHQLDQEILPTTSLLMGECVKKWISTLKSADQLSNFDLSSHNAIRDLICAVILDDLSEIEQCLQDYQTATRTLIAKATVLLQELPDKWEGYAARPITIYESMSDELYHEYTVVFPIKETQYQEFYVNKAMEKQRVQMFLEQTRYQNVETIISEAGFKEEWLDLFIDHVMAFDK